MERVVDHIMIDRLKIPAIRPLIFGNGKNNHRDPDLFRICKNPIIESGFKNYF